ncbi:hypothetical protein BH10PSE10_BH10PSE10_02800 [soil metagenome]
MYDFKWHQSHGDLTLSSARAVAPLLLSIFDLDSVLDVGCGDGRWLSSFKELGVFRIKGIDGPWTERENLLIGAENFEERDLCLAFDLRTRFSLAVSLEVAEHVSPVSAEIFVKNMVRHSDLILFGAAIPFQGGFRHINERWQSEWADLFSKEGFQPFDLLRAQLWNRADVSVWYKQNMLVYINRERRDLMDRAADYIETNDISQLPVDIVHPERYEQIASYSQIAFKGLLKKLPGAMGRKFADVVLKRT